MRKRYLAYTILLLLIVIAANYFYPMSISEIIKPYIGVFTPYEIEAQVDVPHMISMKEFAMDNEKLVEELFVFLEDIKVRRTLINPTSFVTKTLDTYMLSIHSKEGKYLWLFIMNKDYIKINGETYKILDNVDLSKISPLYKK